ncbi:MAG: B12-binding domain-containing protein [Aeromicrobium sp.]
MCLRKTSSRCTTEPWTTAPIRFRPPSPGEQHDDRYAGLQEAIAAGNRVSATALTQAAVEDGVPASAILDAMTSAMDVVGNRFQRNEIFVPEMPIAARAMKEAMTILEPLLVAADVRPVATAIIGTVKGDLHDIGKNLVGMMWKGANIAVVTSAPT